MITQYLIGRFRTRHFRYVVVLLMIAAQAVQVYSQPAVTVSGRVFDNQTKDPLPGATILYARGLGTVTDQEGKFSFSVNDDIIHITVQYVGYQSVVRHINASSGELIELTIGLDVQISQMDQVVVSAGRAEQRLADLTVSMSIIKPGAITASHITDAQDLMNRVSGIEVLDGQASIRGGSGFSYGAGSRVMVLIDGLPMLSADAGHVKWYSLPLENIAQVEVIKGAASVMYGSSALNGVVNFRTAEASREGKTSFFAETGIFGKPQQKDWVWWDSPRTFSSASLSHQKKYGNTDVSFGSFFLYDNGYRLLNDRRMGRANLRVKHQHANIEGLAYGLALNGVVNRSHDFILWENAATGALKQDTSTAQLLHGTSLSIDPFIAYDAGGKFRHTWQSRIQTTGNDFPEGGQTNSNAQSLFTEYILGFQANDQINISAGLMNYSSRISSNFYGDHTAWNLAGYVQGDWNMFERLKMTAGLRLEGHALNGEPLNLIPLFRTGMNYRAFDVTFFRASFGQGYRYPSIAEKYAATSLGAVKIIPNPLVVPEKGWNAELAVKQGVVSDFFEAMFDLAFFYAQNQDMIEYVFGIYPDPVSDEFTLGFKSTNIEYSRVYGMELEFLMHLKPRVTQTTISGGYVFMYPVEYNPMTAKNTDKYLKFRRKHAANLQVATSFRSFELGLQAYLKSRILDIDNVFLSPITREGILPGFYDYWLANNRGHLVFDLSLGYTLSANYKLSLALKNLTNTEYMGRPGDIQPHRHISLRVTGTL